MLATSQTSSVFILFPAEARDAEEYIGQSSALSGSINSKHGRQEG